MGLLCAKKEQRIAIFWVIESSKYYYNYVWNLPIPGTNPPEIGPSESTIPGLLLVFVCLRTIAQMLDFKLSPCSECCMLSSW
jgi:hypothetical protein